MGKAKGKHRLDKYYHQAKDQGFRSRAAYKLIQLDVNFGFLPSARSVLDLCAAPGSWMQVVVTRVPVGSFVLGVDIDPIRPIRGALSLTEDITTQKCRSSIRKLMDENRCRAFDVVLHDGSPNVGGRWAAEATGQSALVIDAVKLAVDFLAPKGTFLTKVFRSQDYTAILYCLRQLFEKVEVTKPDASRKTSAEIFVVGLRYKAPAKIDPRLLDVKYLFQGTIEPPKIVDVLRGSKQKRNREGYEDGNTTLRKICLVSDFVWSEMPLDILGSVASISFNDPACLPIRDHELTTEEVKTLCDDLRVLGKQDFKHLLKWRMHIRKALSPAQKSEPKTTDIDYDAEKGAEDDQVLKEMEELSYAVEHKKKRAKKLLAKRRAKDKIRKASGMNIDAMEDGYQEHELFSLSSIKQKKQLQVVDSTDINHCSDDLLDSEIEETQVAIHQDGVSSDVDSDEEQRLYDDQLEEFLDEAYERFLTRKEGSTQQRKRAKAAHSDNGMKLLEDEDMVSPDEFDDSDNDAINDEANPLMVPLHNEEHSTQEQITKKWFSQDVFADEAEEDIGKNETEDEEDDRPSGKMIIPKNPEEDATHEKDLNLPNSLHSNMEDFEIVPAIATDSSDESSSDESELDCDSKAEILAYAKKMLRKKQREQIVDDAYNKYMFDDEGLPTWFVEEEKRHRQPMKPVTKEEVAAMKAQFREIDARPAKKVAEAKARKKRIAMRNLEKVRQKANAISDQTDINDRSKTKMIDRLYKKATPKKPQKEYVVAKKGVQVKGGKGKVIVDRRMKKDARSRGSSKLGKGGRKGKGPIRKSAEVSKKRKGSAGGNRGKKMKKDF